MAGYAEPVSDRLPSGRGQGNELLGKKPQAPLCSLWPGRAVAPGPTRTVTTTAQCLCARPRPVFVVLMTACVCTDAKLQAYTSGLSFYCLHLGSVIFLRQVTSFNLEGVVG